jgi:hypothetical protein
MKTEAWMAPAQGLEQQYVGYVHYTYCLHYEKVATMSPLESLKSAPDPAKYPA